MSRKKNTILRHRFSQKNKDVFTKINTSIEFDKFLFNEDIDAFVPGISKQNETTKYL